MAGASPGMIRAGALSPGHWLLHPASQVRASPPGQDVRASSRPCFGRATDTAPRSAPRRPSAQDPGQVDTAPTSGPASCSIRVQPRALRRDPMRGGHFHHLILWPADGGRTISRRRQRRFSLSELVPGASQMDFRLSCAVSVSSIAGLKQAWSGVFPLCDERGRWPLWQARMATDRGAGLRDAGLESGLVTGDSHRLPVVIQHPKRREIRHV
jgi:hypothetical protein